MASFSVVVATRNRPLFLRKALESILAQTCSTVEIIVVNDGSGDECHSAYQEIVQSAGRGMRFFSLIQRPLGHGPSYVLNFGVGQAIGDYVCFLDDDDEWSDPEYLSRVSRVIDNDESTVDVHLSDQAAFANEERMPGPIWIEDLAELLQEDGRRPEPHGAYRVTIKDLLRCHGFAHLNTLIVRRALFEQIGGLDECIRYECDRELFLRLIDQAQAIRYSPGIVSHHRVPDPGKSENESTRFSSLTKHGSQLMLLNKTNCFSVHPALRAHSQLHMVYALKKIAEDLVARKRYPDALFYARLALAGGPTLKWAGYTLLILIRVIARTLNWSSTG
jgi:glycosyltransferase involved in cell wall biosynthesis